MKTIYADFNDISDDGVLPLSCQGSIESLRMQSAQPLEGEEVWLSDGELWVRATLHCLGGDAYEARSEWNFRTAPPQEVHRSDDPDRE